MCQLYKHHIIPQKVFQKAFVQHPELNTYIKLYG